MRLDIPPKRQRRILLHKPICDIIDVVFCTLVAEFEFRLVLGGDNCVPDHGVVELVFPAGIRRGQVGEDLLGVPVEEGFKVCIRIWG